MSEPEIFVGTRAPRTRLQRFHAYRLLWTLALLVFTADQLSKLWIVSRLPFDHHHSHSPLAEIELIPGFFYFIHVGNTGAAWSILSGKSTFLALLALGTLVAIFLWRHSLGLQLRQIQLSFGLLCGGIVGNLLDRLLHGHVIDFVDLHFGSYTYPTFNIADAGICIGVGIYLWHSFRQPTH